LRQIKDCSKKDSAKDFPQQLSANKSGHLSMAISISAA
jgi:hypothetical protein